jgi:hypothetical protein
MRIPTRCVAAPVLDRHACRARFLRRGGKGGPRYVTYSAVTRAGRDRPALYYPRGMGEVRGHRQSAPQAATPRRRRGRGRGTGGPSDNGAVAAFALRSGAVHHYCRESVRARHKRMFLQTLTHFICDTHNGDGGCSVSRALMEELFGAWPAVFRPSIPHLVYQYDLYVNYAPAAAALSAQNPEIPE